MHAVIAMRTQEKGSAPHKATKPRHDVVRTVDRTTQFKRDMKRETRTASDIGDDLDTVIELLTTGKPLPHRYRDHRMWGTNREFRDLHLKPDVVLIYRATRTQLILVRIGSHSTLFG